MGRPRRTNCMDCGVILDDITTRWAKPGQSSGRCHDCYNRKAREYHQETKTPEKTKEYQLRFKYGITLEQYNKMVEFQQNGCAICRQPCESGLKLAVDHNHGTGEIRGLLCKRCNLVLGHINDDENLLWNIMEYLKRTTWNKEKVA